MYLKERLKSKKFIFLLAPVFLLIFYAFLIEPNWIEVTHHQVIAPVEQEIRIVQVSDLHTKGVNKRERALLAKIERIKPHVIVITGDVSSPGTEAEDYFQVLSQLKAPLGVYLVSGNWEYWASHPKFSEMVNEAEIVNLNNKNVRLGEKVWLVGFDDHLEGVVDETKAFANVPDEDFKIGIFHSPAFFDDIFQKLKVSLSGHTHGGQVRIPFFGAFWLPPGSGQYSSGWYYKNLSSMYVSRGLGTSVLPLRLLCRPELSVFTLKGQN